MMKNKSSFIKKIQRTNTMMGSIIIIIVALFSMFITWSSHSYNQIFIGYRNLQDFYSYVNESSDNMKSYLTTNNEENLSQHEIALKKAKENIVLIQNNIIIQEKWRFKLLENMLAGYEESAVKLMDIYYSNDTNEYRECYEAFLQNERLIQETSTSYYHLITDSMSLQTGNLGMIQQVMIFITLIVSITLLIWVQYVSRLYSTSISRPLSKVLENIERIKNGQYDLKNEPQSSSEMQELYESLKEMAGKIAISIETEKKNATLEKKLVQSELKMLQNQINPHFLFNTLNTIYCMTEKDGAHDASDMLLKTSQLLRYGLEKQSQLSTLEREVQILGYYIDIQQKRFLDKVEFHIEAHHMDEIGKMAIPGMILQPLVENAIKHGLKDCVENGLVEVLIRKEENEVKITVSDNGKGMDSKALEKMFIHDFQNEGQEGLGLYNVIHRLKMHYGDKLSIGINSDLNCGFEVNLSIQIEEVL